MQDKKFYRRFVQPRLLEALADSPAVLIHGPRQCGKSTLALHVGAQADYRYITFDDDVQRASADADPVGFVADLPDRVILDEVQRVPRLFTSIKAAIDQDRRPGRFLLTGSANVLFLPMLADSLAGRLEILRLHPLSQAEVAGVEPAFLASVFAGEFSPGDYRRQGMKLAELIASGGYPAALKRTAATRRAIWYRDYVATVLQRDVVDLAKISSLNALPRLLALAAGQTARLINISDLAAPFQISRPTIRDYVTLLEQLFLLEELTPWHSNRTSRLIKKPKLHLTDTGVACALLDVNAAELWEERELLGQLLETFVYQELRRQASWQQERIAFHHFRNKDGLEVDIVLEASRRITGIEVKASSTVTESDFKGLHKLKEATDKRFATGIVLYDGTAIARFGERLLAVPVNALWL